MISLLSTKRSKLIRHIAALFVGGAFFATGIVPTAHAATYYWDTNGNTAGFGSASGTWGTSAFWSTSTAGTGTPTLAVTANTAPTTDVVNFGTAILGLGAGTVNVGMVNSGNITFGAASGAISLTGGTITLNSTEVIAVNNATDSIGSLLAGAATSLTKTGYGTLVLNGSATNTFTGAVSLNGGTVALDFSNIAASTNLINALAVTARGGNLAIVGKTGSNATTQTLGNISAIAGGGTLLIDPNNGLSTTLTLGTLTATAAGSSMTLGTAVTANTGAVSITTTTAPAATGIYSGRIVFANGTANTGYDWATSASGSSPYTLSAYSSYSTLSSSVVSDTLNSRITASQSQTGNVTTNSLKIEDPAASQSLDLAGNTLTLTSGGLLVTGTNAVQITGTAGNKLTAGNTSGAYDLVVSQYNSGGLTIGAVIGNNGANVTALTKAGTGSLTLTGTNTFTGGLFINAGNVILGNAGALNSTVGSENAVALGADITSSLTLNGNSVVVKSLTSNAATVDGSIVQNASATPATLTIGNSTNTASTFAGTIQDGLGGGTLGLVKAGTGTLILSGTNTFSGGIIINAGMLSASSDNNLGAPGNSITFNASAAINFPTPVTFARNIAINGVTTIATFDNGGSEIITGNVTGTGGMAISNTNGSQHLFNGTANTFEGKVDIGLVSGTTGQAYRASFVSLADSATANGRIIFHASSVTHANGSVFEYTGTTNLALNNRQVELASATANPTNGHQIRSNGTGTLSINTDLIVSTAVAQTLSFGGSNTGANTFGGNIINGSGTVSVTKVDAGSWALSGTANTFTGAITLNTTGSSAGTLSYASAAGTNPITFNQTTSTATLSYTGSTPFTMSGAITASALTTGTITLDSSGTGAINYSSTSSLGSAASGARNLVLSGTSTGTNTLAGAWVNNTGAAATVAKNGVGTWVLSGANTYTGNTTINAGALEAIDGTSLPSGSGILQLRGGVFQSSGTFTRNVNATANAGGVNWSTSSGGFAARGGNLAIQLNGGTSSLTWNGSSFVSNGQTLIFGSTSANALVDFQNSINLGSSGTNVRTISVIDNPNSTTDIARISGALTNTAAGQGIDKTGNGTLQLTATNTYTGNTTVSAGTLVVNGSITTSPNTSVANGATLGGSGTTGAVTLASGATLAPGNSPGTLSTGAMTWTTGANYNWQAVDMTSSTPSGSNFDSLTVAGTLDVQAGFNFNLWSLSSTGPDVNGNATGFSSGANGYWIVASATSLTNGANLSTANVFAAANNGTNGFMNSLGGGSFTLILGGSGGAPGTPNDVVLKFTASTGAPDLAVTSVATPDLFVLQNASLATASSLVTLTNSSANTGTLSGFTPSNAVLTATTGQSIPASPGTVNSTISLLSTGTNTTAIGATVTYQTTATDANAANNVATVNVRIGNAPLHATASSTNYGAALVAATPISVTPYTGLASNTIGQTATGSTVPALGTSATIYNYTNSTGTDTGVSMAWRTRTAAEASSTVPGDNGSLVAGYLVSDVVNLTGMGNAGGTGFTDTFILQMSYNEALLDGFESFGVTHGNIVIAWKDGLGNWINAVNGNSTPGGTYYANQAYNAASRSLGDYGIDPVNNVVWAVLNHNSEFAVIPEPSTLVLGGLALLGFAGMGLRKRRMAKLQS
jgi:fibronectin-binding autotransporter adhesin